MTYVVDLLWVEWAGVVRGEVWSCFLLGSIYVGVDSRGAEDGHVMFTFDTRM